MSETGVDVTLQKVLLLVIQWALHYPIAACTRDMQGKVEAVEVPGCKAISHKTSAASDVITVKAAPADVSKMALKGLTNDVASG